ncbi:hypothetical protein Trydic_g5230 [Trypoxylus dichotomus]
MLLCLSEIFSGSDDPKDPPGAQKDCNQDPMPSYADATTRILQPIAADYRFIPRRGKPCPEDDECDLVETPRRLSLSGQNSHAKYVAVVKLIV